MLEWKTFLARASRRFLSSSEDASREPQQHRLMVLALSLLLVALVVVLYHDRDFWFPDAEQAENRPSESVPASQNAVEQPERQPSLVRKSSRNIKPRLNASAEPPTSAAPVTISSRTVLPPLEVEVIAGDSHRTVRPPSNEVKVDLDADTPQQPSDAFSEPDNAANLTSNAAEHVQMSDDTSQVVSRSIEPGYPLLARQMKVQGSVILTVMIGRDGSVQDLRVLSGPPILATAAREAVRQWHFKPHMEGSEAVETIARVTVNFTISTN
jgi:TonB family protein